MKRAKTQFRIFYLLTIIFSFSILFFDLEKASSAEFIIGSENQEIGTGSQFEVDFFLNSENEDINAVEGEIVFPSKILETKEIVDGGSIINLWLEHPDTADNRDKIIFSGIIPGGYNGEDGKIFSVIFHAKEQGSGEIEIINLRALLNDGDGNAAKTNVSNLSFKVSSEAMPISAPSIYQDIDIPELFTPIISRNRNMFGGKYFLVFATQDKGSGISHYEVSEGGAPYITAKSPYLLQNQNLDAEIFVKAIDKAGNERIVSMSPKKARPWYKKYFIFIIILVGIAAIFISQNFLKKLKNR